MKQPDRFERMVERVIVRGGWDKTSRILCETEAVTLLRRQYAALRRVIRQAAMVEDRIDGGVMVQDILHHLNRWRKGKP